MDFRSMLNHITQLSEETKQTPTGRIHKGSYGTSYQPDEKRDEYGHKVRGSKDDDDDDDKKKEPAVKRGRGRPSKSGEHSKDPAEKKKQKDREEAGKKLQSAIIGNIPKKSKELDKLPKKKHSLKEWVQEIEDMYVFEATQQLDELSPRTLSSYAAKAAGQAKWARGAASALPGRAELDPMNPLGKLKREPASGSEAEKYEKFSQKRKEGIKKAVAKGGEHGYEFYPGTYGTPDDPVAKQRGVKEAAPGQQLTVKPMPGAAQLQDPASGKVVATGPADKIKALQGSVAKGEVTMTGGKEEMAEEGGEKWIKGAIKHPGAFTKKAKSHNMSTSAFAKKVLANKDDYPAKTEKQAQLAKTLSKLKEVEQPTMDNQTAMGAGLGAGRKNTLESAKPDYPDIDNDGNEKEPISKAAKDAENKKKKKKVNESMHKHSAARLMGKAHALAKEGYNCKYEDIEEAKCYHEGYKEGLDECYGQMPIVGLVKENPAATVPGMAQQADDIEEGMLDKIKGAFKRPEPAPTAVARPAPAGPRLSAAQQQAKDDGDFFDYTDAIRGGNPAARAALNKEVEEGNYFTGNLKKAREAGKSHADLDGDGDMEKVTEFAFESWDKELNALLESKEDVSEGMSVSISKGNQGAPDSVTVSAQDSEADALLGLIKQAGLGLFGGDEPAGFNAPKDGEMVTAPGGIEVVGDHDGMMGLIKKLSGAGASDEVHSDYEDEEGDEGEEGHGHDHEHTDEETCNECGYMESECGCDKEVVDEVESSDQMAYEVAEDNPPDSGAAETTADENAEAAEDEALATAAQQNKTTTVNEWANAAGKGPGKGTDASFEQDIEFMTKVISGGLNKPKSTGQTTIPVIPGQETRMEDPMAWARLAGIKK